MKSDLKRLCNSWPLNAFPENMPQQDDIMRPIFRTPQLVAILMTSCEEWPHGKVECHLLGWPTSGTVWSFEIQGNSRFKNPIQQAPSNGWHLGSGMQLLTRILFDENRGHWSTAQTLVRAVVWEREARDFVDPRGSNWGCENCQLISNHLWLWQIYWNLWTEKLRREMLIWISIQSVQLPPKPTHAGGPWMTQMFWCVG